MDRCGAKRSRYHFKACLGSPPQVPPYGLSAPIPKPVWSGDDLDVARQVVSNPSSLIPNTWNKDPTKFALFRAIVACQVRVGIHFGWQMVEALAQTSVCFLHFYSLEVEKAHY